MPKAKLVFAVGNAYRQMAAVGLYISDISIYLPYFGYIFYWLGYRKFLAKLRKNAKVEPFKRALDDFLQAAPDEPTVQGCQRATASNSLFHQIPMGRVTNGCQLRWKAIMWRTKHVKISNKVDHWPGQMMICCMEDWTALYTLFCSLKSIQYWWKGA